MILTGCTARDAATTSARPSTTAPIARASTTTTGAATSTTVASAVETMKGEVVFTAPYGDGPGEFGFVAADESVSDGPRAFWPEPDGDLYILDPVHHQVQVAPSPISSRRPPPIPTADALAPRDLAVASDGTLVIDDSDGSATYQTYSAAGEAQTRVPSAFGQVISVGLAGDGTVVYAHLALGESGRRLVYVPLYQEGELLDPAAHIPEGDTRIPLGDGWTAEVGTRGSEDVGGLQAGSLRVYEGEALRIESTLEPAPLGGVVAQRVGGGGLLVSALTEPTQATSGGVTGMTGPPGDDEVQGAPVRMAWLFDDGGTLRTQVQLPLETNLVDVFVTPVRTTPDATVYALNTDDKGLTIRRYPVARTTID